MCLPLLLGACKGEGAATREASGQEMAAQPSVEVAEMPAEPASEPFETRKFEKKVGDNRLEVEYPVAGNPTLLLAVRTWINDRLGATYRGSLDDAEAFFRHYGALLGTDPDLNEYGGYAIDEFEVEYESPLVLTYDYESYEYEGGAHGMGGSYGTTFLKSDGSIFDKDCITSYAALHGLIVEGLKRYFKAKTDAELLGELIGVESLAKLTPPGMKPWIEKEGVVFSYTPYEIAPYSAGSPRFTIPYAQIAPYLTERGKRFF